METDESVIEIKGNYLHTVPLKRLSFPYPPSGITHLSIHPPVHSSTYRPLHSSSVHPSISRRIIPPMHPPTKVQPSDSMSQLPTPKETETPLGFVDQKSCIKTSKTEGDAAEPRLIVMRGRSGEGPSVRSHWGQATAATFSKANSPEEQSTSPVVGDYSIIASASVATPSLAFQKFIRHTNAAGAMSDYGTGLISFGFVAINRHPKTWACLEQHKV